MLSYRHGYHAGNFADVWKHTVLCLLIQSLLKKEKPFCYLDTHAGAGGYDLKSALARKNREHDQGIARIWQELQPPAALLPYLEVVRAVNSGPVLSRYPGSPQCVRHFLRSGDRMELCELHGTDQPKLKSAFIGDSQVHVHHADGYQALKAFLPPRERRGLVLCDPAYELKDERKTLIAATSAAWQRWPTGIFAIWYPILARPETEWFHRQFKRSGIGKILIGELRIFADDLPGRLNGSGMLVINAPWKLDLQMAAAGSWLAERLALDREGVYGQEWLVPE